MDLNTFLNEERQIADLLAQGMTKRAVAQQMGLSEFAVHRRIKSARRRANMDPELRTKLERKGLTSMDSLHSGWLLEKDKTGSGHSLYFYLGTDEEKIDFASAVRDTLTDIPRLTPINLVRPRVEGSKDVANWLALADLHVGGDYGDPRAEVDFNECLDDVIARLPPAEHAVLFELGDLFEANDHKGVTPASGNMLDVRRGSHLTNTMIAIRLMRRAIYRLLETHETVEVHLIPGNHDPDAYIAVAMALLAHFELNSRVEIVVSEEPFRVISWGLCAAFPNHGHELNWQQLKDVWCDQFADSWAAAKMHRIIMTAHFHHDRKKDLIGCVAEQFRTLHRPNDWAKRKGLFSRGSLTAMTVHKEFGEIGRIASNLKNTYEGRYNG